MARQISSLDRPVLGFEEWFLGWWREMRQWPWVVQASIEEQVRAGRWLTLSIDPDDAVWMTQEGGKNRRYRLGYELPVRFIHERLTLETAQYLRGVTDALRAAQGLNAKEGLGLLLFLFVVGFDYHRMLTNRDVSMLFPPPHGKRHGDGGPLLARSLSIEFISQMWDVSRTSLLRTGQLKGQHSMAAVSFLRIPPANLRTGRPAHGDPHDAIGGAIYDIACGSHAALFGRAPAPAMGGEDLLRFLEGTAKRPVLKDDFTQLSEEELEVRNMFVHEKTQWRIAYEGERLDLLGDLSGFHVIQHLLVRPGKGVPGHELCQLVSGSPPVGDERRSEEELEEDEKMTVLLDRDDLGVRSDKSALRDYVRELGLLRERGREAARAGQHDQIREIAAQIKAIDRQIHSDSDGLGRPRKEAPNAHRVAARMHGFLQRAYKVIGEHCPALESHLRTHIRPRRGVYTYAPEKQMDWQS